jgi:hypothetical protein
MVSSDIPEPVGNGLASLKSDLTAMSVYPSESPHHHIPDDGSLSLRHENFEELNSISTRTSHLLAELPLPAYETSATMSSASVVVGCVSELEFNFLTSNFSKHISAIDSLVPCHGSYDNMEIDGAEALQERHCRHSADDRALQSSEPGTQNEGELYHSITGLFLKTGSASPRPISSPRAADPGDLQDPHLQSLGSIEDCTYNHMADQVDIIQGLHPTPRVESSKNWSVWRMARRWSHGFDPESNFESSYWKLRPPTRPAEVIGPGTDGDLQGIKWKDWFGIERQKVWNYRDRFYPTPNSRNFAVSSGIALHHHAGSLFKFRSIVSQAIPMIEHFQLRNLITATSQHDVFYAGRGKVMHTNPLQPLGSMNPPNVVMDFSSKGNLAGTDMHKLSCSPYQITALTSISDQVLVTGLFEGEYAMLGLSCSAKTKPTMGRVSSRDIVNHIEPSPSHTNLSICLASNTKQDTIATVDCTTNTILSKHTYKPQDLFCSNDAVVVNCTSTSPDGRLRLLVGDFPGALLTDTLSGKVLRELPDFNDNAFACAWAPDGYTLATAAEDEEVRIWDARSWRVLQRYQSYCSSVRSLRFSSVGGQRQLLFAAEARDVVTVYDTARCGPAQLLPFVGEVAGVAVSPSGGEMHVGNGDPQYGGVMTWDQVRDNPSGLDGNGLFRQSHQGLGDVDQQWRHHDESDEDANFWGTDSSVYTSWPGVESEML